MGIGAEEKFIFGVSAWVDEVIGGGVSSCGAA